MFAVPTLIPNGILSHSLFRFIEDSEETTLFPGVLPLLLITVSLWQLGRAVPTPDSPGRDFTEDREGQLLFIPKGGCVFL